MSYHQGLRFIRRVLRVRKKLKETIMQLIFSNEQSGWNLLRGRRYKSPRQRRNTWGRRWFHRQEEVP